MPLRLRFEVEKRPGPDGGLRGVKVLLKGARAHIDVGWSARWTDGETVRIATINTLGGIKDGRAAPPARDAITPAVEANARERKKRVMKILREARRTGGASLGRAVFRLLEKHAEVEAEWLREAVWDLDTPPNAPSTVVAKGEDNPLIRGVGGGSIVNGVGAEADSL